MNLTVPRDYDRYPEFRKLEAILEKRFPSANIMANFLFLRLWTELAYQAAHCPLGCLPKDEFTFFYEALRITATGIDEPLLLEVFKASGMLKEKDAFLFSLMFFTFNEELSREFRASQMKATDAIALKRRKERYQKGVSRDVAALPPEYFNEVDGQKIEAIEMNRIVVLIRCLDSIFSVVERDKKDFGVGVIHDACRMLRRLGPDKTEAILQRLLAKRKSSDLPRSTEQLLANLDSCLVQLEPDEGWGVWSKHLALTTMSSRSAH